MPLSISKVIENIERFYSDRSGEIDRGLRYLHIVPDKSQPGVPQNNAVAEQLVQDVLEGTRTALLRAGLQPCFWEYACRHYCTMGNALPVRQSVAADGDGDRSSPWENTHEALFFPGKLIPLGSKVIFKPSETKQGSPSKMEPAAVTGIFAGYGLAPGCKWNGIYMVWSLDYFCGNGLVNQGFLVVEKVSSPSLDKGVGPS